MDELKQGWLSPTGEFFQCSSFDHYATAKELAEKISAPSINKKNRQYSDDDRLLAAGWAYIGIGSFLCHEWRIGWEQSLTPEQVQFLRPYFEDGNGIPVNSVSGERWKWEIEAEKNEWR